MSQLSDVKWFTLGWPLSLDKLRDFCATVRYIGFDWDFELKLVSLLEEKRIYPLQLTEQAGGSEDRTTSSAPAAHISGNPDMLGITNKSIFKGFMLPVS